MDSLRIIIPNYDFTEKIGEGPQTIVYKGYHKKNPEKLLVIKILKAASLSENQKAYFRQKVEHLKVLHDSRLILPLSFEEKGGIRFITQDYFNGMTLDEWSNTLSEFHGLARG